MKLALGTVQFGMDYGVSNSSGHVSQSEVARILGAARRHGIDVLDTAAAYGTSESTLGKLGLEDWRVVTKLPPTEISIKEIEDWTIASVNQSLSNLCLPRLYAVLVHRPSQLLSKSGQILYKTLQELKRTGVMSKIGVSIYDPIELDLLFDKFEFDLVQVPLSIFDRRLISSGWMDALAKMGVEIHVRSVFLQGLLTMSKQDRPSKFGEWSGLWGKWDEWLDKSNLTAIEACIRFVLSQKLVDKVVVGVQSQLQLEEILRIVGCGVIDVPEDLQAYSDRLLNPALWKDLP